MRFDAVLFDNGGTLTHRSSPVATICSIAARLGVDISEEDAARYWRRSKEHSRALMAAKRVQRNLSRADHRSAYVTGYAPFEEIAPGMAELVYDEWKANPKTMVPYPDTPATLKSFSAAGMPIAIVSNTGWSVDAGYAVTGLDAFISTFVLSCDIGIAKPDPEPFLLACERLGVEPERTLMVGNNRLTDSGSICVGCHCLILPPVPPGATRGLRAAVDAAAISWLGDSFPPAVPKALSYRGSTVKP
ncbi:MAG TPA: HAD family hydrolase [Streptosporangiaceae bacterium]|nr:HAD family hydrolase [Streptosporangiaceae bacterium]